MCGNAVGDVFENESTGGVHDVDALAACVGHDPGLLGQDLRAGPVREHQEADGFHAEPSDFADAARNAIEVVSAVAAAIDAE